MVRNGLKTLESIPICLCLKKVLNIKSRNKRSCNFIDSANKSLYIFWTVVSSYMNYAGSFKLCCQEDLWTFPIFASSENRKVSRKDPKYICISNAQSLTLFFQLPPPLKCHILQRPFNLSPSVQGEHLKYPTLCLQPVPLLSNHGVGNWDFIIDFKIYMILMKFSKNVST